MSARTTTRNRTSTHPTSIPTPPLQRTSSRPGSSRPNTPSSITASRGDIPFSRKSSYTQSPTPKHNHQLPMSQQPSTPTPRKPRRPRKGNKPSQQRNDNATISSEPELGEQEQEPSSEDEEMLFDLLGVTSPAKPSPKRGVLNLSKDDMDIALGKKPKPRKGNNECINNDQGEISKSARNQGSPLPNKQGEKATTQRRSDNIDEKGVNSEGDIPREMKGKRGKKGYKPPAQADGELDSAHLELGKDVQLPVKAKSSAISASRPKNLHKSQLPGQAQNPLAEPISSSSFDTSSLSKSLPSRGLTQSQPAIANVKKNGKKNTGSEDESAVWEMPSVAGGQELTWQQKLQASGPPTNSAESSPRKSNKSTPSDKKKSNRCAPFQQQASIPAVSSPLNPRPQHNRRASADGPPSNGNLNGNNRTISAFDSYIPFHTGYNVHRAPQTPAKGVASFNGNNLSKSTSGNGNINLPIVGSGEFPRLRDRDQSQSQSFSSSNGNGNNDLEYQRKSSLSASTGLSTKYAGPTFHNSPNAASLSKPDLEDF
ncbi:uncharacterized protein L201_008000 [Kwoniella dendrophila CBS 6074]|uniref:Mif2 N-terminal domain-containing protein n=1 Tax=Kwoniella dendrophila CBS 6074 TaxID=1295534 RepID=A0AAX4K5Y7_9TREE